METAGKFIVIDGGNVQFLKTERPEILYELVTSTIYNQRTPDTDPQQSAVSFPRNEL